MKKIIVLTSLLAGTYLLPNMALAQVTSSGTLGITANIDASISMVFDTDASGVTLTGTGTNAVTLAFGNVSAYDALSTNVSRFVNGVTNYIISTPFDVKVTEANSSSANFTLTAQLNSADIVNTWAVGGVPVTNGTAATVNLLGAYGSDVSYSLALAIPFSEAATPVSNTINFTAISN